MDVAMIYRGDSPHPAHRGFAEAIDADLLNLDRYSMDQFGLRHSIVEEIVNGVFLPDYDVYIAEGTRALYGSLTKQIMDNSILIYLAGDQALYKLLDPSYTSDSVINNFISNFGMNILKYLFNKHIDGIIAVSEFSCEYTTKIITNKPTRVANPYIQPGLFDQLGTITPDVESKTAITVGTYAKYKGQDILVNAWKEVRREHPEAQLQLVGKEYPSSFDDVPGVEVHGYVEDLPNVLSSSALYIQPSRMDNFPVSVLEALRAGLPAVVTNTTGNSVLISQLNGEMIVEPTANDIAAGIIWYFNLSRSERKSLSSKARSQGNTFDSESRKAAFSSEFQRLINDIG